jgi:protein TonB
VYRLDEAGPARAAMRWSLAGLCVLAWHGALIHAALNWPHEAAAAPDVPAAVMIELAPVPVAPETPPQDVALGPQMQMSEAATPSEQQDKPVEEEPETQPEAETEVPTVPEKPVAEIALPAQAPPNPKPPEKPKVEPRKRHKPEKAKKAPRRAARNAPATTAPQAAEAQRAAVNAASAAGTASSVSPATWRSMLMALLNRRKRFPPGGGRGTATVAFAIDRTGKVLSASLARSSGDAALDQEAVALARRISPVPAPPATLGHGGTILFAVPVRFGE